MEKWADYLISAVRYTETLTTKHISQVRVHKDFGNSVGNPEIWSRESVVNAINLNTTFMTIMQNADGSWRAGAKVQKIWIFNAWYIKTVQDNTQKDNLGSLPEF